MFQGTLLPPKVGLSAHIALALQVLGTMLGQVLREPEAKVQVRQARRWHVLSEKMTSKGLSLGSFFMVPFCWGFYGKFFHVYLKLVDLFMVIFFLKAKFCMVCCMFTYIWLIVFMVTFAFVCVRWPKPLVNCNTIGGWCYVWDDCTWKLGSVLLVIFKKHILQW